MKKCYSCKFYHPRNDLKGTINGECRYNPPLANKQYFPTVKQDDWCGKFINKNNGGFW